MTNNSKLEVLLQDVKFVESLMKLKTDEEVIAHFAQYGINDVTSEDVDEMRVGFKAAQEEIAKMPDDELSDVAGGGVIGAVCDYLDNSIYMKGNRMYNRSNINSIEESVGLHLRRYSGEYAIGTMVGVGLAATAAAVGVGVAATLAVQSSSSGKSTREEINAINKRENNYISNFANTWVDSPIYEK